mmetsp:Transcript_7909/g.13268  ORF Transcript_7909/g.13268 Transcript_7909/m.13268 type:complete len:187 (-) Transcript_7909:178-738(-)
MISVYKTVAVGINDHALTFAGAIGSVCNGSSRIFWATIQDYLGFKFVYMMMLLIQLFASLMVFTARSDEFLYIVCLALTLLCEGGHFAVFPAGAVKIFGLKNGGLIFTFMFVAVPLSSLSGFFLVELGDSDPEFETIILKVAVFLTALNIVLLFFFDDQPMKLDAFGNIEESEGSFFKMMFRSKAS